MDVFTRYDVIRNLRLCFCCFGKHFAPRCRNKKECRVEGCSGTHHKLLHRSRVQKNETPVVVQEVAMTSHIVNKRSSNVLFRVVPVNLYGPTGKQLQTYAFLDEGSFVTLVEQSIADKLLIKGTKESLCLCWTNNLSQQEDLSQRVSLFRGLSLITKGSE